MLNAIILNAQLSFNLWKETLLTAFHLHNRISSIKFKILLYELWKHRKPSLEYLKVWGYFAFSRPKVNNVRSKGNEECFCMIRWDVKSIWLLDLDSNVKVEWKDLEFIEYKFYNNFKAISNATQILEIDLSWKKNDIILNTLTEPRRS